MQNSGRFSLTSITGSPGFSPCACKALANEATSRATSVQLSDCHCPAVLRQRKGASPIAFARVKNRVTRLGKRSFALKTASPHSRRIFGALFRLPGRL